MISTLAIALGLGPVGISAAVFSGLAFLIMFGIASAKGDFQGLVKTTLENDAANRKAK
tara:strand:+ start:191 stop:364 length:174 start_codon:yes stop_codon:yes gene_type:complete